MRTQGQSIDFSWIFGGGSTGLVDVNKLVDFALLNKYAGTALTSKTLKVYEHSTTGVVLRETLTTDGTDGTVSTARTYPSATVLSVYYESSNDKQWFTFTVPQMNPSDAESATVNAYTLESFAIGTYSTDSLDYSNGTTISDAGTHNTTEDGTTPSFKYSLANTGSDNTGLIASHDPLYGMDFNVVLYMTFSGTGYEKVVLYGSTQQDFTLGTTRYVALTIDPYKLTTHKEGWEYKSRGTWETSFWMDLSSLTSSDSVTWQTYVYAYSDPVYMRNHGGDYGYEKVEIAEHTVTLTG